VLERSLIFVIVLDIFSTFEHVWLFIIIFEHFIVFKAFLKHLGGFHLLAPPPQLRTPNSVYSNPKCSGGGEVEAEFFQIIRCFSKKVSKNIQKPKNTENLKTDGK